MIWYMSSVAWLALEVIGVSALMEHPSHCALRYAALRKFKARAPLQSGSLTIYQLCNFLITFPTLQDVHYWISTTSFIQRMIKTCCQELIALASHQYDKWPSHLSTLLPKKREIMFSDDVISKAQGGDGDNAGRHQRASLALLAEFTVEGHFLKAVSAIHNSQICSCWPSLHILHTSHFDPKCCTVNRVSESTESLESFNDDPRVTYWKCQIGFLDEQAVPSPSVSHFYFGPSCPDHSVVVLIIHMY